MTVNYSEMFKRDKDKIAESFIDSRPDLFEDFEEKESTKPTKRRKRSRAIPSRKRNK